MNLRPAPARPSAPRPSSAGAQIALGRAGFDLTALARSPLARLGALALVLAVVAFLAGRWSASSVEAQNDASTRSELERASLAPPASGPSVNPSASASLAAGLVTEERDLLPEERALRDARNKYTIQAIQYQNKERFQPLAAATYDYLKSKGLPVCRPVVSGSKIYILIGAAPSSGELERELLARVRGLPGPDGRAGEFASAYIAPIDHLYQRGGP